MLVVQRRALGQVCQVGNRIPEKGRDKRIKNDIRKTLVIEEHTYGSLLFLSTRRHLNDVPHGTRVALGGWVSTPVAYCRVTSPFTDVNAIFFSFFQNWTPGRKNGS